jgi:hypothetical protein
MIEDMGIRNFAPATQYNYINAVAKYALHFGKSPELLGPEDIRTYQVYLVHEKHVGWSMFNTAVCALRFSMVSPCKKTGLSATSLTPESRRNSRWS